MSSNYQDEYPAIGSSRLSSIIAGRNGSATPSTSTHHGDTDIQRSQAHFAATADAGRRLQDYGDEVGLSEDLGPRTLHRRAKPKPGIPFKVLKARNAENESDDEDEGDPDAPMANLPPEILARIFGHLDPRSITQCANVCAAFARVVSDDRTWRLAFSIAFHIEARSLNAQTTPILRRVDATSWRAEYIRRASLLRTWRRTRSAVVTCDPRISTIHAMALSRAHNFLLCASEDYGVATRCQPFTGKVSKGFIDSSGLVNGVGAGALAMAAEHAGLEVSCLRVDADAGRIIWGFHSGVVGVTTLGKQGTDPRGLIRGNRLPSRNSHVGAIIDVALPFGTSRSGAHGLDGKAESVRLRRARLGEAGETFVTAGIDGTVRLWSSQRPSPLWTACVHLESEQGPSRRAPVVCVTYDVENGVVAAGDFNGEITVWCDIDVKAVLEVQPLAFDLELQTLSEAPAAVLEAKASLARVTNRIVRHDIISSVAGVNGSTAPRILELDSRALARDSAQANGKTVSNRSSLLVLRANASGFQRYDITIGSHASTSGIMKMTNFNSPKGIELTCLRTDFDVIEPATSKFGTATSNAAALFTERKFVCAGTQDGHLAIWDWDQEPSAEGFIEPWLYLEGHASPMTAIDLTEHAVVLGFADGTIRVMCPLTGQLLRTLNDRAATRHPARMLAAGELTTEEAARFKVTQIIAGSDVLVASIGSEVLAWHPEPPRTKANARKATTRTGRASVGRLWDPKMQSRKEMERDVFETRQELDKEHQDRLDSRFRVGSRPGVEVDGLTEEEMFEYAMMLSRDAAQDEEERRAKDASMASEEYEDLQDALEQIAMVDQVGESSHTAALRTAFQDSQDTDEASGSASRESYFDSPSAMPMTSPPSRAWDILQNAGPSAKRNTRLGDEYSKVQAVRVPQSARLSHGNSQRPSLSPSLHAQGSQQDLPTLDSPAAWPSFQLSTSAAARSPSRLDLGPPEASERISHTGAQPMAAASDPPSRATSSPWLGTSPSGSSASRPATRGAWVNGSPLLRPVSYGQDASRPNHRSNDEDEDLRLAIELSLAEEQSRKEARL